MLKPVFTEKSLKMARQGQYTFWVDKNLAKPAIKSEIAKLFNVHVVAIKTIKKAGETGRNVRGRKYTNLDTKKAVVTLKSGQKLDIFEETKK